MSQWAQRRKMIYGLGVFTVLAAIVAIPLYQYFNQPPTCFDGIQNQDETDVDRGGPCVLLDSRTLQPLRVSWARTFPVREGVSNALVYIENPNIEAGAKQVPYQVRLYDAKNILVAERKGVMDIIPSRTMAVFEGGIQTGNRVPVRAFFSFLTDPTWVRMYNPVSGVVVRNITVKDISTTPRLEAEVQNTNVVSLQNIQLVIGVFDDTGNAFAGSRTVIDRLDPGEHTNVILTWPHPFTQKTVRADVIPTNAERQ